MFRPHQICIIESINLKVLGSTQSRKFPFCIFEDEFAYGYLKFLKKTVFSSFWNLAQHKKFIFWILLLSHAKSSHGLSWLLHFLYFKCNPKNGYLRFKTANLFVWFYSYGLDPKQLVVYFLLLKQKNDMHIVYLHKMYLFWFLFKAQPLVLCICSCYS